MAGFLASCATYVFVAMFSEDQKWMEMGNGTQNHNHNTQTHGEIAAVTRNTFVCKLQTYKHLNNSRKMHIHTRAEAVRQRVEVLYSVLCTTQHIDLLFFAKCNFAFEFSNSVAGVFTRHLVCGSKYTERQNVHLYE